MTTGKADLRALAQAADEGYTGAHPRDSNNWQANEAFCRAFTPKVARTMLDVIDAARAHMRAAYSYEHEASAGSHGSAHEAALARIEAGRECETAKRALRSALAALDQGEA